MGARLAQEGARRTRRVRLVALCIAGAAGYVGLRALSAAMGDSLPGAVVVGVPFLLVPAIALWWWGEPPEWGALDRRFLFSAVVYTPFAAWLIAALPTAPTEYFGGLPDAAFSFPGGLLWAAGTFAHVGAVDYFTKRVVQRESEHLWGMRRAQLLQMIAWTGGHVVEWLWLRYILGDIGAWVFLVAAGALTGWAFARWRCVVGLMFGHLLVNVAVAVAAVVHYG